MYYCISGASGPVCDKGEMKMIYLDSAATTKIDPGVLDAMMPYLQDEFGNAGTLYPLGRRAECAVAAARSNVANFIHAKPEQIIFTSGGSEGNNLVLLGLVEHLRQVGKTHIIVSAIEHKSVLRAADALMKLGFHVTKIRPEKDGRVNVDELESMIGPDTGLVSVMMVNNELGSVNDVSQIGRVCKDNGVLFHTDCVQAAGVFPIDVEKIGCDFLTLSSHKIHGPKGVGAIFAKDPTQLTPIIWGGTSQEFGLRGGTANVAGIVGLGAACNKTGRTVTVDTMLFTKMKQVFFDELLIQCRAFGYTDSVLVNGASLENRGKILNLQFPCIDAESLVLVLGTKNICISAGSACNGTDTTPSHVLKAVGLSDVAAKQSVRISFDFSNSLEDIYLAAREFAECIVLLKEGVL